MIGTQTCRGDIDDKSWGGMIIENKKKKEKAENAVQLERFSCVLLWCTPLTFNGQQPAFSNSCFI